MANDVDLQESIGRLERKIAVLQASLAAIVSGIEDQEGGLYLSPILAALQRLDDRLRAYDASEEERLMVRDLQALIWELRNAPESGS